MTVALLSTVNLSHLDCKDVNNNKNKINEAFKILNRDRSGKITWNQVIQIIEGKLDSVSEVEIN